MPTQPETEKEQLFQRAIVLEYLTIGYNMLEALFSFLFGMAASSIALIGFGLDSLVESLSGSVLLWRLRQHGKLTKDEEEKIERRASRLVAITFLVLGVYVLYESLKKLSGKEIPGRSLPGIVIAVLSLITMPLLAWQKNRIGKKISSRALVADSKETLVCAFLSLALLLGLGLNYLLGFWQADPLTGILIVWFLFREGWQVWKESSTPEQDEHEN